MMIRLYRYIIFGGKKRRERFIRGLRMEMLVELVGGNLEVVDNYLFQRLRNPRPPITYTYHSAAKEHDDPYRYLRFPVAKV
jgi:hypothetical protein